MSENKKDILGVYEELKGILASIPDNSWFDDEGFVSHTNRIIQRAGVICREIDDINSYLLKTDHIPNRGPIVNAIPAKSKLNALIGRLKGTYDLDTATPTSGHTFVQNQSQTQSQHVTVILELQERIINEIPKYPEGSKERTFLEKLKSALPTIKNVTDILSVALKIGADLGLDAATIDKVLGL